MLVKYGVQCSVVQCSVAKIPCNYKGGAYSYYIVFGGGYAKYKMALRLTF